MPQIQAAVTCHRYRELLHATDIGSCYMPQIQAVITCHRYRQLLHATDTDSCYMPQIQAVVTCHRYRQLLHATDTGSWYMPQIQADVSSVLFMNEVMTLTNVVHVIGKLGKLVQKQNCSQDLFYFMYYNIVIVQVRYIILKQLRNCSYWIYTVCGQRYWHM